MMGEQEHLRLLRELGQYFDSGAGAVVVEVDKDIIQHERHGFLRCEVLLDAREAE